MLTSLSLHTVTYAGETASQAGQGREGPGQRVEDRWWGGRAGSGAADRAGGRAKFIQWLLLDALKIRQCEDAWEATDADFFFCWWMDGCASQRARKSRRACVRAYEGFGCEQGLLRGYLICAHCTELKKCKPQTPQGHSGLRPWGHQHWVYTSLGRSCAVASLLLPGLRGEENFRRGFRAPPPAHPLSVRPHWQPRVPRPPPTGSALRWLCGTRSNHVVSRLSYMPLAVRPVSNYGPPKAELCFA